MERIDIREIRMGKWHIPKKNDIFNNNGENAFQAIGYFDMLEVKSANKEGEHPLKNAYEQSYRISSSLDAGFSVQEIKAFTNIITEIKHDTILEKDARKGFTKEQIDNFWEDESLVLYISMVHLDIECSLEKVTDTIRKIFTGEKYLYYITFDYSGIVILTKDISFDRYVKCLFQLNYLNGNLVRDTFSVFSFDKNRLQRLFEIYSREEIKKESVKDTKKYLISVNISVKEYEEFFEFERELEKFENNYQCRSRKTWLLGRHDISIVNENENNFLWLTYIQYLLNKYSSDTYSAFWTYESFIKVEDFREKEADIKKDDSTANKWDEANRYLRNVYEDFCNKIKENNYNIYFVPVKEVMESVFSILKNGFAEDFIICIYQSFIDFMGYLTGKIDEENRQQNPEVIYRDEFENCFSNYFTCLNALVNSAMHSDRQFIQATAFNAIIYDVPPKMMAFYVAVVYNIQKIIWMDNDSKYTFFLTPGFNDEISVKIISYREKELPKDRILKVSINEKSLYNPEIVIRSMAHEIAHYVGDGCRKRDIRKKYILKTLIFITLNQALDKVFPMDNDFYDLVEDIMCLTETWKGFCIDKSNYSSDLEWLHREVLDFIIEDREVSDKIHCYVHNKSENIQLKTYIEKVYDVEAEQGGFYFPNMEQELSDFDIEYLGRLMISDINKKMENIRECVRYNRLPVDKETILGNHNMNDYMRVLISLYSETYADLQMILLLNISYDDYLLEFIHNEGFEVDGIENDEDIFRMAVISKLFQDIGLWTERKNQETEVKILDNRLKIQKEAMNSLEPDTGKKVEKIKKKLFQDRREKLWEEKDTHIVFGDSLLETAYPNVQLYHYLCECLMASADQFCSNEEKIGCILKLRDVVKTLQDFEDIHKVYDVICSVVLEYKKELIDNAKQKLNGKT